MGRSARQIKARAEAARIKAEAGAKRGAAEIAKLPNGLAKTGTLSRTVAQAVRGEISSNVINQHGEAGIKNQYKIAMANKQIRAGQITAEQYQSRVRSAGYEYREDRKQMTQNFGHTAAIKGKSEATKQYQAREIAEEKGIGIGTVQKDGSAQVSVNSSSNQVKEVNKVLTDSVKPEEKKVSPKENFDNIATENTSLKKPLPIQGAEKITRHYSIELKEGGQEKQVIAPHGSLSYIYGTKQEDPLSRGTTQALQAMEDFQTYQPSNDPNIPSYARGAVIAGKSIADPIVGFSKATLATFATFGNLGRQGYFGNFIRTLKGEPIRTEPKTKDIVIPSTFIGDTSEAALTGKDVGAEASAYVKARGVTGTLGELGEIGLGAGGGKPLAKLVPLKYSKYNQPGLLIKSTKVSNKIKTPINTPQVVTSEVKVSQASLGWGRFSKPIASKVGDKFTWGDIDLTKVSSVEAAPVTAKQGKRGVKLAADSTRFEQKVNKGLIDKIEGLPEDEKEKAKIIEEIIDITTKPKEDTLTSGSMADETFEHVTKTEQPSFVGSLKKEQGKLLKPIGSYEGSLSHQYFVLPKYLRKAGDVDLHASSYDKAARQISNITPRITPDEGRAFEAVTIKSKQVWNKEKQIFETKPVNSAKTFIKDSTGKREKVIEIINPDEVDEKGISQVVEGDTLFGKNIPSKTYAVDEGKTFGRQRQILKKGESIYSIQTTKDGLKLEPAPFRKMKDEADFYALIKSAQETEFSKGSAEYSRLGKLIDDYKGKLDFDVEDYLSKAKGSKETDRVVLKSGESLIEKAGSTGTKSLTSSKSGLSVAKSLGGKSLIESIGIKTKSSLSNGESIGIKTKSSLSNGESLGEKSEGSLSSGSLGGSLGGKSIGSSLGSPEGKTPPGKSLILRSTSNNPITSTTRKPKVIAAIIDFKNTTKKTKGSPEPKHDFLGGTKTSEVWGFRTVKKDIDVGDKKTAKLYKEDVKKAGKKLKTQLAGKTLSKKKSFLSL